MPFKEPVQYFGCGKMTDLPSMGECLGGVMIHWCAECKPPLTKEQIIADFKQFANPVKENP